MADLGPECPVQPAKLCLVDDLEAVRELPDGAWGVLRAAELLLLLVAVGQGEEVDGFAALGLAAEVEGTLENKEDVWVPTPEARSQMMLTMNSIFISVHAAVTAGSMSKTQV